MYEATAMVPTAISSSAAIDTGSLTASDWRDQNDTRLTSRGVRKDYTT